MVKLIRRRILKRYLPSFGQFREETICRYSGVHKYFGRVVRCSIAGLEIREISANFAGSKLLGISYLREITIVENSNRLSYL